MVGVLDGNTIIVTPYGDPFTVRLLCMQAPQLRQGRAGLAAKATLQRLLQPGTWVSSVPWSGVTQEEQPRRSRG